MDRLTLINDALIATGNEPLNVEYDGSDEWRAADSAYRRAVSTTLQRHNWNFATTLAPLAGLLSASPSQRFGFAYALPGDCLHVVAVTDGLGCGASYEIVDNRVCAAHRAGLSVRYVRLPAGEVWPPLFTETVTRLVEAYLLASLNEDTDNARRKEGDALSYLAEARTRSDQQEPPKVLFRSRVLAARRGGRGPWREPPPAPSAPASSYAGGDFPVDGGEG